MRKGREERPRDHLELLPAELVERQPLHEEPAVGQPARRRAVHVERVEVAGARVPGDEQVRHDDVEARAGAGQVAPAVVEDQPHVGPVQQAGVPLPELRAGQRGHVGDDLDHREIVDVQRGRRAGADAGGHADEDHATGRGVQQERQEALAALVALGGAAAEHVVVVQSQLAIVAGVDDAHDAGRALLDDADRLSGIEIRQRRAAGVGHHGQHEPGVGEPAQATVVVGDGGEDERDNRGQQEAGAQPEPGQDHERRRQRAAGAAHEVGAGQRADRPGGALALAEGRPQRGKHEAGGERRRPRGERGQADDAHEILRERGLHADIAEATGQGDERPHSRDRRGAGQEQTGGGEARRVDAAEQDGGQLGAGGQREQEHQAHRGERVDRVVQDLREERDPQDLQAHAHEPGAAGDQPDTAGGGRRGGGDGARRRRGRVTDREGDQPGQRADRRRRDVARGHAQRRRQPEAHGGDADGAAERVERVERAAAPPDQARRRQRLAERRQRGAERGRHRDDDQRDDRHAPGGANGAERALGGVGGERPEGEARQHGAGGDAQLEQRVATNGPVASAAREPRAGGEAGEVAGDDRGRRRGGGAEHQARRAQPEQLEAERARARQREAGPQRRGHAGCNRRARCSRVAPATARNTAELTATSAGPSGRS